MANKKFSQFTNQPSSANTFLVGYDGTTNVRIPESDSIFKKGHEPYLNDTFISPLFLNGPAVAPSLRATNNMGASAIAYPFMLKQDVNIKKFRIDCTANPNTGFFVIYEYNSHSSGTYTFDLFYQEASATSFAVGINTVTLPTPVKLTAGKVYITFVIPDVAFNMSFKGWLHDPSFQSTVPQNNFLGQLAIGAAIYSSVALGGNVTMASATQAPSSINIAVAFSMVDYLELEIQNA